MTTTTTTPSRWEAMTEFTRVAVALTFGVACIGLVLLLAESAPFWYAGTTWFLTGFHSLNLTPMNLTTSYLMGMYAGLLGLGLTYAFRNRAASSVDVSKDVALSAATTAKKCSLTLVGIIFTGVIVCLSLLDCTLGKIHPFELFTKMFLGAFGSWGAVFIVFAAVHQLMNEGRSKDEPTFGGFLRTLIFAPGLLFLCLSYSVLNLGLFLGLVVMAVLLAPLESKKPAVQVTPAVG